MGDWVYLEEFHPEYPQIDYSTDGCLESHEYGRVRSYVVSYVEIIYLKIIDEFFVNEKTYSINNSTNKMRTQIESESNDQSI